MLAPDDPRVVSLTDLVRSGDVEGLRTLLDAEPHLAAERFGDADMSRTALHVATDWPGTFPASAR